MLSYYCQIGKDFLKFSEKERDKKMDKNVNVNKGGLSIFSILTIIFVVLKAFGIINFTWFQCFIPLIIGFALTIIILIVAIIFAIIANR